MQPAASEPSLATMLTTWSGDALPWIGVVVSAAAYLTAARLVNLAHPHNRVRRWRVVAWLAGLAVIALALTSPLDVYADTFFSLHMVQHLLLAMVAPPLLALGAPVTLALRVAPHAFRRTFMIPVLHSRVAAAVSWPPLGWVIFAGVMAATHFSPLFNAALDNEMLHSLEHLLYFAAGLLFWWPVIAADPGRWRLGPIARMAYLATQMPPNAAVGLAIYFAPGVLYAHYAAGVRTWGPSPLIDQQVAGLLMWGAGDLILLGAVVLSAAAWLRADERRSRRVEERAARREQRAIVDS